MGGVATWQGTGPDWQPGGEYLNESSNLSLRLRRRGVVSLVVPTDGRRPREAAGLGLRGTPSFLINGAPVARPPTTPDEWRRFLDEQLKAVR